MSDEPRNRPAGGGIAIIGMAGRFPGARSVAEFWQNLRDGVESVTFYSDEELLDAGVEPSLLKNPSYVKAWAALEDAELFDASFFGYNPREAEFLDPQQRILLECAWEALEDAGYDPDTYPGSIGMWAGSGMISYYVNNIARNPQRVASVGAYQTLVGNVSDFAATRVAYKLNLKGPSFTVLSACSSSLVSVHVACSSLLGRQCDMALAGGVYVRSPRKSGYLFQPGMIMSPDGHCRAFDEKAAGIIGGEGVGLVVLKRLEDALADGDSISAVIRGSAVNNDGSAKVGFTAPSVEGQAAVIRLAHELAGWGADSIGYVEAHGTATPLGDPIEIAALTQAFRAGTEKRTFCAIGSVKTNIGHLDAAAGIAGLIKAVLAVRHGVIPPSLHFRTPNPQLHIDESPFFVATRLMPWPALTAAAGTPRRAGVNSFGIGGTNAHVLIEEAPGREQPDTARAWHLLLLSANTTPALRKVAANLHAHLAASPGADISDVCYTLQVGRRALALRQSLVCRTAADACDHLLSRDPPGSEDGPGPSGLGRTGRRPRLVFMFSGQGSQYAGMTRGIYTQEQVFREAVDSCSEILRPLLPGDLREAMEDPALLDQTLYTQPALFVVEYCLARLLETWGIKPDAMIGHSIGELVAACLAGVFSLDDALRLVARRAALMQAAPGGAMLSVFLPEQSLRPYLKDGLSLAVTNGPGLCVVSGASDAIDAVQESLQRDGLAARRLLVSHAFHSPVMKPAASSFLQEMEHVALWAPRIPLVSNVTGQWITESEARDPHYWCRHLLDTVRFSEGLSTLFSETESVLLEVGPGNALSVLAGVHPGRPAGCTVLSTVRHPHEDSADMSVLLSALGRLWESGIAADWARMHAGERRRRLPLPSYPFEKERFWVTPADEPRSAGPEEPKRKTPDQWMYVPSWKRVPLPDLHPARADAGKDTWLFFIDDHWLGLRLQRAVKAAGDTVVTVRSGPAFERMEKDCYTLDPDDERGCSRLIADLHKNGRLPTRVVHLWNVRQGTGTTSLEKLDAARGRSLASLLSLCRSLGDHHVGSPVRIDVISTGLHDINGEEMIEPEKALLLGACTVIPQEYPHFTCRSIDIPPALKGTSAARLVIEQLRRELQASFSEPVVAFRHRSRWIPHFEQLRPVDAGESVPRLKEGGVYLITGGLGLVGLTLARVLAERKARLVLVGRSPFPPRQAWDTWQAEHGPDDPTSVRISALASMEELGASVAVLRADVGDEGQMRAALSRVDRIFGGLDGVIHAAGVVGDATFRPIADMGAGDCAEQLHGKARGALVLEKVLGARELDFRMMTSSLSSVLGGLGFAAYAAANAFLDAFAHSRVRADGAPWMSVNWDAWRSEERRDSGNRFGASIERLALTREEGAESFRRLITVRGLPQVILSTADIEKRRTRWSAPDERVSQSDGAPVAQPLHGRPLLASAYRAPQAETEKALVRVWEELLGIDKIGIDDNFFDLGGHSLLATQVISRLRRDFHVDVSLRVLFEAPTIAALAPRIEEEIIARIDRLGEHEAQESMERTRRSTRAS